MGGCFQFLVHGPYRSHSCPILDGLSECIHYSASCRAFFINGAHTDKNIGKRLQSNVRNLIL